MVLEYGLSDGRFDAYLCGVVWLDGDCPCPALFLLFRGTFCDISKLNKQKCTHYGRFGENVPG